MASNIIENSAREVVTEASITLGEVLRYLEALTAGNSEDFFDKGKGIILQGIVALQDQAKVLFDLIQLDDYHGSVIASLGVNEIEKLLETLNQTFEKLILLQQVERDERVITNEDIVSKLMNGLYDVGVLISDKGKRDQVIVRNVRIFFQGVIEHDTFGQVAKARIGNDLGPALSPQEALSLIDRNVYISGIGSKYGDAIRDALKDILLERSANNLLKTE